MRWTGAEERFRGRVVGALVLVVLVAAFVTGSAAAAGNKKLVKGTVYDTTCAGVACGVECPPPPHCGPITMGAQKRIMCPMADLQMIACPLSKTDVIVCVQAKGCPGTSGPPVWMGKGGVVTVRKRGSTRLLMKMPITEGHFGMPLGAGEYVLRPYLPEPQCWTGEPARIVVSFEVSGPVSAALDVRNSCAAS